MIIKVILIHTLPLPLTIVNLWSIWKKKEHKNLWSIWKKKKHHLKWWNTTEMGINKSYKRTPRTYMWSVADMETMVSKEIGKHQAWTQVHKLSKIMAANLKSKSWSWLNMAFLKMWKKYMGKDHWCSRNKATQWSTDTLCLLLPLSRWFHEDIPDAFWPPQNPIAPPGLCLSEHPLHTTSCFIFAYPFSGPQL